MKKGLVLAVLFGIILPWILSFLFLTFFSAVNWTQMPEGIGQYFAILSFASIAFEYNIIIVGYGYVIPLLIWIITGLFCGLLSKSALKGVLITLLGLFVNILLFVALYALNPAFIPGWLITAENIGLLGGISIDFLTTLGLFLCLYSFTLPGGLIGGMIGGIISRSPIVD